MSETIAVLRVSKQGADRVDFHADETHLIIKNKIGWEAQEFQKPGLDKIKAFMTKNKKDAEFCISFDGGVLKYFARVGSDKVLAYSAMLSSIKDHNKRFKILDGLVQYKATTQSVADAVKERDPLD